MRDVLARYSATELAYLVAAALFILALYWMNSPQSARRGVFSGVLAMMLAVVGTALDPQIQNWTWIIIALVLGFAFGIPLSWVPLTAVPQRTALSHAFGGLAAGLVGTAEFYLWSQHHPENLTRFRVTALVIDPGSEDAVGPGRRIVRPLVTTVGASAIDPDIASGLPAQTSVDSYAR